MKRMLFKIAISILITISVSILFVGFVNFLTKGSRITPMKATIYFHGKVIEVETSSVYYELGNLIITDKNGKEYIVDTENVLLEDM